MIEEPEDNTIIHEGNFKHFTGGDKINDEPFLLESNDYKHIFIGKKKYEGKMTEISEDFDILGKTKIDEILEANKNGIYLTNQCNQTDNYSFNQRKERCDLSYKVNEISPVNLEEFLSKKSNIIENLSKLYYTSKGIDINIQNILCFLNRDDDIIEFKINKNIIKKYLKKINIDINKLNIIICDIKMGDVKLLKISKITLFDHNIDIQNKITIN